jgi:hypothetical protein
MTSVRKLLAVLFGALLLSASAAFAADVVTLHYDGAGNNSLGGYLVYPYYVDVNGGPIITVACDDFYKEINDGDTWTAYRTYLSSGDVSNTRLQDLVMYAEIRYLAYQFTTTNDPVLWGELNWAIWELSAPGLQFVWDAGIQTDIANLITTAEQNYAAVPSWVDLIIYTPTSNFPLQQEVIEVATPEPGSILLLGSGLVGLWSQRKRIF